MRWRLCFVGGRGVWIGEGECSFQRVLLVPRRNWAGRGIVVGGPEPGTFALEHRVVVLAARA